MDAPADVREKNPAPALQTGSRQWDRRVAVGLSIVASVAGMISVYSR